MRFNFKCHLIRVTSILYNVNPESVLGCLRNVKIQSLYGSSNGPSDGGCKIINGAFHLQVSVKRASTLVIIVILKQLLYNGV